MRTTRISKTDTQPIAFVIVHNKNDYAPVFALTNKGIGTLDVDTVRLGTAIVPIKVTADEIVYTEERPTGVGTGMVRRSVSFGVYDDTGGPFSAAPFSAGIYTAGANVDKFFFSVWLIDIKDSLKDLYEVGTFFGYYDLDAGLEWDETTNITSVRLVDRTRSLTTRYSSRLQPAETLLAGSEWQRLLTEPAYLGYRAKVPAVGRAATTIGGFDTYNKAIRGVVAGLVQTGTLDGTSIVLGKSPTLASLVGDSVKLKFGNGCLVTGTITDLGDNVYGINTTGMSLNVAWDTVLVYNKGWTALNDPLAAATTDLSSIFLDNSQELTKFPSTTMYLRTNGTPTLYNGGPVAASGPLFIKLSGIADEANKELSCELMKDPANAVYKHGGVSVTFDAAQQTAEWSGADIHLNYAKWMDKQSCNIYFTNKTNFVLADVLKQGMPWELISTPHVNSSVEFENAYYIKLAGDSTLATTETGTLPIYASDGSTLTVLADTNIESVTYNCGDFGVPDLCKIVLTKKPSLISEDYSDSELYVDTSRVLYAGEVITYILKEAGIPDVVLSPSLTDGSNKLGNPMSVVIGSETWTDLLDSVVFESGVSLGYVGGYHTIRESIPESHIRRFSGGATGTQKFMFVVPTATIIFGDVVDGTYKLNIGRTYTNIDADGREYVRVYYDLQYPYSYFNGQKLRRLQSVKAIKDNDRKIDYTFKHIVDTLTATAAAVQMSRVGGVASIPETTREVTFGLPLEYVKLEVLDVVALNDFRHVTRLNAPLPQYVAGTDDNPVYTYGASGAVYGKYTEDVKYMLLPGIGIINSLSIALSERTPAVSVSFKQVQAGVESNLKQVIEALEFADPDETTTESTGGDAQTSTPAQYTCVADGSSPTTVAISAGDVKISGITIADPCCNSSVSDGDSESDQRVTIYCTDDDNPDSDEWPDTCIDNTFIRYEAVTDNEVGSTDTLIFNIISLGDYCPRLKSITYPGQSDPDMCVSYADLCTTGSAIVGKLYVSPCVFNKPENLYSKAIQLIFVVAYCQTIVAPNRDDPYFGPKTYTNIVKSKEYHLAVPVTLRPVSDISLG